MIIFFGIMLFEVHKKSGENDEFIRRNYRVLMKNLWKMKSMKNIELINFPKRE